MTDQNIRKLYQAGLSPAALDAGAEAELAAALLGGSDAARDAGLDRLATHPHGPALARIIAGLAPDSAQLSRDLQARRQPVLRPVLAALAATAAAMALIIAGLRDSPVQVPEAEDDRIMVASFDSADGGAPAANGESSIFRADFGS
jgi:hypothetical protein